GDRVEAVHVSRVPIYGTTPVRVLVSIPFASGSARIPGDARTTLAAVAEALASGVLPRLEVAGYADAREGPAAARLARQRAERVRDALVALGVDPKRLTAVGHGTEAAPGGSPDGGRPFNASVWFSPPP